MPLLLFLAFAFPYHATDYTFTASNYRYDTISDTLRYYASTFSSPVANQPGTTYTGIMTYNNTACLNTSDTRYTTNLPNLTDPMYVNITLDQDTEPLPGTVYIYFTDQGSSINFQERMIGITDYSKNGYGCCTK